MRNRFTKMLAVLTAVLMLCCMLPFFTACGGDFYPNYPKSNENPYALQPKNTPKPAPIKAPEHDPNEAVVFSDAKFEDWFRTTYNYGKHEIITYGKLLEITELELSDFRFQSFKDIAMFANLTELHLVYNHNKISDIDLLLGLTKLKVLDLFSDQIVDLSPFARFTNLTALNLGGNQISDISPLSGLTNLTELTLSVNDSIFYLDALSGLKNLTVLNLSETLDPKADLSPLAGLTKLTRLNLGGNQISDISPLAGLTELTWLKLGSNQISDISPLARLTKLTELDLKLTSETDVSPLFNLTLLKRLYLGGSGVTQEQRNAIKEHLPNCEIIK